MSSSRELHDFVLAVYDSVNDMNGQNESVVFSIYQMYTILSNYPIIHDIPNLSRCDDHIINAPFNAQIVCGNEHCFQRRSTSLRAEVTA